MFDVLLLCIHRVYLGGINLSQTGFGLSLFFCVQLSKSVNQYNTPCTASNDGSTLRRWFDTSLTM